MNLVPALRVRGLGKDYRFGRPRGYTTLRESLVHAARAPSRWYGGRDTVQQEGILTALDDVSFDVAQGEAVGFIGHNGAGKSTLLKVLTRITEPTRGLAEVRGRVGSLLEVGTGFHPELTGRENIYLNGAVLGMSRQEIAGRFDEIVDFADVERFLDTPVKRYSSGMYVRLAFAVAAHLEPEVLIVDEVLAVGDAAFQRKSVARMASVAREGRTVLFVSHNMAVIQALCRRAVVLRAGRVLADAPVEEAVTSYLAELDRNLSVDLADRSDRSGRGYARVRTVEVTGGQAGVPRSGAALEVRVETSMVLRDAACVLTLHNHLGIPVMTMDSSVRAPSDRLDGPGTEFRCQIDALPLVPGTYRIDVVLSGDGYVQDSIPAAAAVTVEQGVLAGRPVIAGVLGDVAVPHTWQVPGAADSGRGE